MILHNFLFLLLNISPSAKRFLQSRGNFTLPCLLTIRKVTLESVSNPEPKRNVRTFLLYIKQKFKDRHSYDKTFSLLFDKFIFHPFVIAKVIVSLRLHIMSLTPLQLLLYL